MGIISSDLLNIFAWLWLRNGVRVFCFSLHIFFVGEATSLWLDGNFQNTFKKYWSAFHTSFSSVDLINSFKWPMNNKKFVLRTIFWDKILRVLKSIYVISWIIPLTHRLTSPLPIVRSKSHILRLLFHSSGGRGYQYFDALSSIYNCSGVFAPLEYTCTDSAIITTKLFPPAHAHVLRSLREILMMAYSIFARSW